MSLPRQNRDALWLALVLSLPCLVLLLLGREPELGPDAREYFSQLRSLYFDRDLQLENEFAHYGLLDDPGKTKPTATGHRGTLYSVGPALFWLPFYAAADLWSLATASGRTGYEPGYLRGVGVGSGRVGCDRLWHGRGWRGSQYSFWSPVWRARARHWR